MVRVYLTYIDVLFPFYTEIPRAVEVNTVLISLGDLPAEAVSGQIFKKQ